MNASLPTPNPLIGREQNELFYFNKHSSLDEKSNFYPARIIFKNKRQRNESCYILEEFKVFYMTNREDFISVSAYVHVHSADVWLPDTADIETSNISSGGNGCIRSKTKVSFITIRNAETIRPILSDISRKTCTIELQI